MSLFSKLPFEELIEIKTPFWVFVGPLFLLFSLFLSSLHYPLSSIELWGVSFLGLIFSWKGKWLGWVFSSLVLLSLFLWKSSSPFTLWEIGLQSSIFLSFFITFLSANYLDMIISQFREVLIEQEESFSSLEKKHSSISSLYEEKKKQQEKAQSHLEEKLENSLEENSSLHTLITLLNEKNALETKKQEKLSLSLSKKNWQLFSLEKKLQELLVHLSTLQQSEALYKKNQTLLNHLNRLRVEKAQLELLQTSLHQALHKEKRGSIPEDHVIINS